MRKYFSARPTKKPLFDIFGSIVVTQLLSICLQLPTKFHPIKTILTTTQALAQTYNYQGTLFKKIARHKIIACMNNMNLSINTLPNLSVLRTTTGNSEIIHLYSVFRRNVQKFVVPVSCVPVIAIVPISSVLICQNGKSKSFVGRPVNVLLVIIFPVFMLFRPIQMRIVMLKKLMLKKLLLKNLLWRYLFMVVHLFYAKLYVLFSGLIRIMFQ